MTSPTFHSWRALGYLFTKDKNNHQETTFVCSVSGSEWQSQEKAEGRRLLMLDFGMDDHATGHRPPREPRNIIGHRGLWPVLILLFKFIWEIKISFRQPWRSLSLFFFLFLFNHIKSIPGSWKIWDSTHFNHDLKQKCWQFSMHL